ncbi:MAG: hypothetical protein JNM77_12545 [Pseudonocardia sp.]|nr:hypothetical protein [Pseudonocardia sp.]
MTVHSWDTSLIGVDPASHSRSVLVVPGADTIADRPVLDELLGWGWDVTIADPAAPITLEKLATHHDVALFCDVRGTRLARRALTAILPTVAVVPPRGHGRIGRLLGEAGIRRDTTVLIVRDPRDAKILRKVSGSALVRSESPVSAKERATALAAVLLRAHAWHAAPPAPLAACMLAEPRSEQHGPS